ncbi:hypothetical protein M2315_004203, partial [Agrobacterium fabrum]|nr:hypothetical protein [Agrobacterium fabrum]
VNGRAMTAKLTRHLVNGNLCRHQMMKTAAIGKNRMYPIPYLDRIIYLMELLALARQGRRFLAGACSPQPILVCPIA